MKHFIVRECYDSIPISERQSQHALTPAQADELAAYIRKHQLNCDQIQISRTQVVFINYVGFMRLSDFSIEIVPKVSRNDPCQSRRVLLRMLWRSGYLDVQDSESDLLQLERMNLFEIIASLYVHKVNRELMRGVLRSYVIKEDELHTVRGRIHLAAQMRRSYSKSTTVSCIYDEYHPNHYLNRVLKAALEQVLLHSKILPTRNRASYALSFLDEVEALITRRDRITGIVFDRMNKRYQPSYRLAELLLSRSSSTSSKGASAATSFLFQMNELFESYVGYLLKRLYTAVVAKDRSRKLLVKAGTKGQGVFQLEPDFLIPAQTHQAAVIVDTKWKVIRSEIGRHGVKREDFYQMYAYLTRYSEVEKVILLYPNHEGVLKSDGVPQENWHLEGNPQKRLLVYSLDYEDEGLALEQLRDACGILSD